MATGQKAESQSGKSGKNGKSSNSRRWFVLGGVGVLLVGIAAGAGIWRMQQPSVAKPIGQISDARLSQEGQAHLAIGRITVNIAATGALGEKKNRFLVIEPTLVYDLGYDTLEGSKGMAVLQPAIRDSFIEYLSQLHENDVYGSAGLSELRSELLRRARLASDSEAPLNILLQDFVLQ